MSDIKKPLKAYQLFLIGLGVIIFGVEIVGKLVGQAAGGILLMAGLVFWVAAIVVGIKKLLAQRG